MNKKQEILVVMAIVLIFIGGIMIGYDIKENNDCMEENNLTYKKEFRSLECTSNEELIDCDEVYKICTPQTNDAEVEVDE